jgi:hypothetical protein
LWKELFNEERELPSGNINVFEEIGTNSKIWRMETSNRRARKKDKSCSRVKDEQY